MNKKFVYQVGNNKKVMECVCTFMISLSSTFHDYESNQQDATIPVNLLFLVGSTCFGRCFRPSSGALDFIYSFW